MNVADLEALFVPVIESLGCELVGVENLRQGRRSMLRIYIDKPGGIMVDDCSKVSHQISGLLDVEEPISGQYTLEVSSPGLDRPLFRASDYERFAGRDAKLRMAVPVNGQRRFNGVLVGLDGADVVLKVDGEDVRLALADVAQARLVPVF